METAAGLRVEHGGGPPVTVRVRGNPIGAGAPPIYMAGPCAIESEEQLDTVARGLKRLGVRFLRGGAFKPRTSPYDFQGLGEEGLRILHEVGHRHGLCTVTEATSAQRVPLVAMHADVIQIGSRNMYNYDLLREVGYAGKPVLLKRGFSATLDEWLQAAEYIAVSGNERIILCERGIRTFSQATRNTLDLSVVPLVQQRCRLPIIVDISHAAGRRDILPALAQAAFAVGANGLMVEVHPNPAEALSDSQQQLTIEDFAELQRSVTTGLRMTARRLGGTEDAAPASVAPVAKPTRKEDCYAAQRCVQLR